MKEKHIRTDWRILRRLIEPVYDGGDRRKTRIRLEEIPLLTMIVVGYFDGFQLGFGAFSHLNGTK